MFALVETELTPEKPWPTRMISYLRPDCALLIREDRSLGTGLLRAKADFPATLSARERERRMRRVFSRISRQGVQGVVLPERFSYRALAGEYGLVEAEPLALFRRMAPQAALFGADRLGLQARGLRVGIAARRITLDVEKAVDALHLRARHFVLLSGRSGDAYAQRIKRQWGLSVLYNPTATHIRAADVWLVFEPAGDWEPIPVSPNALVLFLGGGPDTPWPGRLADGARYAPPMRLRRQWPAQCRTDSLLYALWAAGAVGLGEIVMKDLCLQNRCVSWDAEER